MQNIRVNVEKRRILYFHILCSCIIAIVCLWNINKLSSPNFVPDEMGYWTAGAWFNGLNWSSVMSNSGYYGFGYGMLLAFLFVLPDSVMMYRVAVMLNVGMLIGIYFILCYFGKKMFVKVADTTIAIVCLVVSLYTYHIVYSQLTQAEIFVTLLFLLSCVQLYRYFERPTIRKIVTFSVCVMLLFATHFRTVVLLPVTILTLLIFIKFGRGKWKDILICGFIICIGVIIVLIIKRQLVLGEYTSLSGAIQTHNDFSSRSGVLYSLLTLDGIMRLILGMISRLYYCGCATFGLSYVGVYQIIKNIVRAAKEKNSNEMIFVKVYIILSTIAGMAIGSMSMMYPNRIDQILYGRYFENYVAVCILIGILVYIMV